MTGPQVARLTRRLAETPPDFLPGRGPLPDVRALLCDWRRDLGAPPAPERLGWLRGRAAEGSARLALVAAWLMADGELQAIGRGLPDLADRALAWLERDAPELAQVASAAAFVQDEDRREELVRLCLSGLGLVPDGETPNQAEDRLTALSSVARVRAVAAAKEKLRLAKEEAEREEARARQVREELARKAAEEAAAKGSRE